MVCAANVMTGNERDERSRSVGTCGLQAAQRVSGNGALAPVSIAPSLNSSVYTLK
jgi:hypothetical protein